MEIGHLREMYLAISLGNVSFLITVLDDRKQDTSPTP